MKFSAAKFGGLRPLEIPVHKAVTHFRWRQVASPNGISVAVLWSCCGNVLQLWRPCAVRKEAILDPFSPMVKGTVIITVFPDTGLPQTLTASNNLDNGSKQNVFLIENATMLSSCASLVVRAFQGGHGTAKLLLDAVCVLCRNAR